MHSVIKIFTMKETKPLRSYKISYQAIIKGINSKYAINLLIIIPN